MSALLAITLAWAAVPATGAPHPARPNVLLIVLDDARPETAAALPATTRWLRDGTSYPQTVAATPSCGPSRATLLSGRYAHNHGVRRQADIGGFDHTRTLQQTLHDSGYRTAAVGKLYNDWPLDRTPPGFDRSALTGGGYDGAQFVVDGVRTRARYSTSFIGAQARRYLDEFERDDDKPWLLYLGFTAPHAPYTPQPRYAGRTFPGGADPSADEADRADKPAYVRKHHTTRAEGEAVRTGQLRTLLSVDDAIEGVRARLARTGELRDTLVVLVSDNGKQWGEHGLGEKFMPYGPSYRVPLRLWWPGHVAPGTDPRPASTVDVTPTVLAALGITPGYRPDGLNLRGADRHRWLLLEYWRDSHNGGFPTWSSRYLPGRAQYTEYRDARDRRTDREYYDLRADPWQLTNLLRGERDRTPDTRADAAALAAGRGCAGAACP
ncbi:sulfatase-like hydrolase/transferase [Catellatospora tritici]|uniref:sulfatase-like hydrolase/transferase n=1 Tax=Catellatospora tritici TaxID=2851566 RepID=UPI001C2CCBE3|nr:sulfatase-like hydrolase/transferase [Catellatospora tritici]MBV1849299.1 sulfatase-like hydrolase/transferase [Catellatospora tritici]